MARKKLAFPSELLASASQHNSGRRAEAKEVDDRVARYLEAQSLADPEVGDLVRAYAYGDINVIEMNHLLEQLPAER